MLKIYDLVLRNGIDVTEAVTAVVSEIGAAFVEVAFSHPTAIADLQRAGWQIAQPNWRAFMIKPHVDGMPVDAACRLFGVVRTGFRFPCWT